MEPTMNRWIAIGATFVIFGRVFGLTGEEILKKMDSNRDHSTISAKATMRIQIGNEVRTKSMIIKGITRGNKSMVEFTNPEDKGTKYLLLGDNLWIYFPDEQDVVKISGHLLKEGMMGSDVSYEDALEADKLSEKYAIKLAGDEVLDGRPCYVVDLQGKVKDVPYYRRRMWVGKDDFVAWKEEMYAKSGKLLKVARVLAVKKAGKRMVPVKSEMENKLRNNSKTVFEMTGVTFDTPMDGELFTMRYLRR
jgi:outer membrane lipoprotein-sorting protein